MGFDRVKELLDQSIAAWTTANGAPPDLSGHGDTFSWATKADLLAAEGKGFRLIQASGPGTGATANLVLDLRSGIRSPALRMPLRGPFLTDDEIQEIEDWIEQGCPD